MWNVMFNTQATDWGIGLCFGAPPSGSRFGNMAPRDDCDYVAGMRRRILDTQRVGAAGGLPLEIRWLTHVQNSS